MFAQTMTMTESEPEQVQPEWLAAAESPLSAAETSPDAWADADPAALAEAPDAPLLFVEDDAEADELAIQLDLLHAAQAGDQDAYGELQLLLEPGVRRYIQRIIGGSSWMDQDDLVQDVFIRFYMNLARIDPPEKFRAYLYRIARNRCYDQFRAGARGEDLSLDEEPVQMWVSFTAADQPPAPDDVTHWLLLQLEVREAMDRLPKVQRDTLILYAEEGLSYAEIAEVTETSIGTVKSRLFHAKRGLRGLLRPETLAALDDEA